MPQNLVIKYPLDLSANNATNLVKNEPHYIEPTAINRGFALNYGPFYTKSVIVRHVASGVILVPRVDYLCLHLDEIASHESGYEVCIAILITNQSYNGDFEVTYQVVGGEYSSYVGVIKQLIEALQLDDRPILWGSVIGKPDEYPPAPHMHDGDDLYGMEFLVDALMRIEQAILHGDTVGQEQLRQGITNARHYAEVLAAAEREVMELHFNDLTNPHLVNKEQVGLGDVDNFKTANAAEAVNPNIINKFMTPAMTNLAISNHPLFAEINTEIERVWTAIRELDVVMDAGKTTTTTWNVVTQWDTMVSRTRQTYRNTMKFVPEGQFRYSSQQSVWTTVWTSQRWTSQMVPLGTSWNTAVNVAVSRATQVNTLTSWSSNYTATRTSLRATNTTVRYNKTTTKTTQLKTTHVVNWVTNKGNLTRISTRVSRWNSGYTKSTTKNTLTVYATWLGAQASTSTAWYSYIPVYTYAPVDGKSVYQIDRYSSIQHMRNTITTKGGLTRETGTVFETRYISSNGKQRLTTISRVTHTYFSGQHVTSRLTATSTIVSKSTNKQATVQVTVFTPNLVQTSRTSIKTANIVVPVVVEKQSTVSKLTAVPVSEQKTTTKSKFTTWSRNTTVSTTRLTITGNTVMVQSQWQTKEVLHKTTSAMFNVTVKGTAAHYVPESVSVTTQWNTNVATSAVTSYIRSTSTSFK